MDRDREQLFQKVAEVLVANPGASTGEIASASGVSRATLHRVFGARDELLGTVYGWLLEQCNLIFDRCGLEDAPVLEVLDLLVEDSYPLAQSYWLLIAKPELESVPEIRDGVGRLDARLEAFFVRGQKDGHFRPDLPARWLVYSLGSQVMSAWYLVDEGYAGAREVPRLVRTALLDGVRARNAE